MTDDTGCWAWYKNIIWFGAVFIAMVYFVKFLYMLGEGAFGDAADIIASSKFWSPEEIWWGIGFPITISIFVTLFVIYLVARCIGQFCHRKGNEACHMACPVFYESCCMSSTERAQYHNTQQHYYQPNLV